MTRHRNAGLCKVCGCERRRWPKCGHPWHFAFMWQGVRQRCSIDQHAKKHVTSRTEAEGVAEGLRIAIRAGTFGQAPAPVVAPDAITLAAFAPLFVAGWSKARGKVSWGNDKSMLKRIVAFVPAGADVPLGDLPIGRITEDVIEAFLQALRPRFAASTRNKYLQTWKAMSKWGRRKGYLLRPWLDDTSELTREKGARRTRRLLPDRYDEHGRLVEPGEERCLLAVAGPRLQRVILAALETGCRLGELLSLQWGDVSLARRELLIRAEHAKDDEDRVLPVSARLAAVLEMGRTDPAGEDFKPEKFVFGDALGEKYDSVTRGWTTAVLKAHGHAPAWVKGKHRLAPDSLACLKAINLHFHDLRHEAGSRLLEAGWPLHEIQAMLGHADLTQTSTYLNATRIGMRSSMRKLDESRNIATKLPHDEAKVGDQDAVVPAEIPVDRMVS